MKRLNYYVLAYTYNSKECGAKKHGRDLLIIHTRLFHLKVLNFDFKPIFQITLFIEPKLCVVMNLFKKTEQLVLVYSTYVLIYVFTKWKKQHKVGRFLKKRVCMLSNSIYAKVTT